MSEAAVTTAFSRRLREVMKTQDLSVRGLARKIDPDNVERARRNLHRWLDEGIVPHRAGREELATALGVPAEALSADDDEEADPLVALMNALRRVVQDELSKERVTA